jgi:LysM repeat protein
MKIIKILGIAAGLHALALVLIFANPGCSNTKAAAADPSPISAAPDGTAPTAPQPESSEPVLIRYSPTRPGTPVASALETQPVSDVTPATTYTVVRGDSLSAIASKTHLSRADLASANNLKTSSILHIGQKLIIPAKASQGAAPVAATAATAAAAPAERPASDVVKHVVKAGETLGGIARRYGVRLGDIAVANNITDPRRIQPGQELVIPEKSAAGPKQAKPRTDEDSTMAPAAGTDAKPAAAPGSDQDLDAGLKPPAAGDVPVIKVEDATQPKNP